jgi:hypothetical protein
MLICSIHDSIMSADRTNKVECLSVLACAGKREKTGAAVP